MAARSRLKGRLPRLLRPTWRDPSDATKPLFAELGWYPVQTEPRLVVAFSLYGDLERYCQGALLNVRQYATLFPGWTTVIFHDNSVPIRYLEELATFPSTLLAPVPVPSVGHEGMLWRFQPLLWEETEAFIVRDLDCRPSARERAAVDEWLASGKALHIMRDHPQHTEPILGGMCGFRRGALPDFSSLIRDNGFDRDFGGDQRFLRRVVYPRLAPSSLVHQDASYFRDVRGAVVRRFPVKPLDSQFVGQGFEADGRVREGHEWPV